MERRRARELRGILGAFQSDTFSGIENENLAPFTKDNEDANSYLPQVSLRDLQILGVLITPSLFDNKGCHRPFAGLAEMSTKYQRTYQIECRRVERE